MAFTDVAWTVTQPLPTGKQSVGHPPAENADNTIIRNDLERFFSDQVSRRGPFGRLVGDSVCHIGNSKVIESDEK